jgi:membrane protein
VAARPIIREISRRAAGKTSFGAHGRRSQNQNLFLIAGGVTYAVLLALFPGLAALVSLYGLAFDAGQIEKQVAALSGVLPMRTQELLSQELHSLVESSNGALAACSSGT